MVKERHSPRGARGGGNCALSAPLPLLPPLWYATCVWWVGEMGGGRAVGAFFSLEEHSWERKRERERKRAKKWILRVVLVTDLLDTVPRRGGRGGGGGRGDGTNKLSKEDYCLVVLKWPSKYLRTLGRPGEKVGDMYVAIQKFGLILFLPSLKVIKLRSLEWPTYSRHSSLFKPSTKFCQSSLN